MLYKSLFALAKSYAFFSIDSKYFSIVLDFAFIALAALVDNVNCCPVFLPTDLNHDKTLSNFFNLAFNGSSEFTENILHLSKSGNCVLIGSLPASTGAIIFSKLYCVPPLNAFDIVGKTIGSLDNK